MKISIAIATFNQAKNLDLCLKAVSHWADEIVVVDGSSIDDSVNIAKKYGAKVIIRDNPPMFHINKQIAIDNCRSDWILQLDDDEIVSEYLKEEILEKINSNPPESGYWVPRSNFFLGKFLKKGGAYPDYTLRLYRRGKGRLPCKSVHEQAQVDGEVGYLKSDLLHYADPKFSRYLVRFNRYTDLAAKDIKGNFLEYIFLKPLFDKNQGFLSIYFRHLGFLDGIPGFIWALFSSLNFPVAYFKSLSK